LYTRTVTQAPEKLIKNGAPVFGTFSTAPELLDIRGVRRPFASLPLPAILTNLFIRSNIACVFNTGRSMCSVDLFTGVMFGFIEIVFWSSEKRKKCAYRALIAPWRRFIPYSLQKSAAKSLSSKRRLRVLWDRKRALFSFACSLTGDSARPDIKGAFSASLAQGSTLEVTSVLPSPVMRRCKAAHKICAPIKGVFTFTSRSKNGAQKDSQSFSDGVMLFDMYRAYYKIPTVNEFVYGVGKIDERDICFSIASSSLDAANPDKYNENFLFIDGEITPLPPVKITYPFGITRRWIIQDTESMVDLSFESEAYHSRTHSLFVLSTRYNVLFGNFSGVLKTKSGGQITLKDFPGIAKKHVLRL
jgi:hypothetical protein